MNTTQDTSQTEKLRRRAHKTKLAREWREKNREKVNQQARDLRAKYKKEGKHRIRKSLGYPEPTRPKPEKCECCGKIPGKKGLALDHDHVTGEFRGWLCSRCNTGIGSLGDTVQDLQGAIEYLCGKTKTPLLLR